MVKLQLLTAATIVVLAVSISNVEMLSKKNYRVSGIIDFMAFRNPRFGLLGLLDIKNFFTNGGKVGEFLRKADQFLAPVKVTGQISIDLPDGKTGIIATYEGEYVHFGQPLLFSFDYEGDGASLMPKFQINCTLQVSDSPSKYVCDGNDSYQSQWAPTPAKASTESRDSHLSNTIRNKLAPIKEELQNIQSKSTKNNQARSGTLGLLTKGLHMYGYEKLYKSKEGYQNIEQSLNSLIQLAKSIGAQLDDSGIMGIIFYFLGHLDDIEDELFDITGAFLVNLNTQKISEDAKEQPYKIEGNWKVTRSDMVGNEDVEGFGQLYVLPESIVVGVADIAEALGHPIPNSSLLSDLELPFIRGPAYPLYQLRRWIERDNGYKFDCHLKYKYNAIIGSDTPDQYVVFMNMWDSDGDGFLEFDDCLGKGNALGLETVDVSSGSHRFSQCDKDYSVYTTFNRANYPQKDEGTDMIWYKLSGYYTIWADDGSGTFYEPYGNLKFNVGSRSINQGFVVWDVPRDYDSAIRNEHNQTFPFTIYFRESKDFMQSTEKITALGYAKENDGIGHDDGIGNWDGHQWSVNALEEGQYYSNDFPSDGHWAQIKLSLTAIGVVAEPVPEKVEYGLDVKMTFWCDSDKGGSYEAYGDLSVNFGSLAENQRVQLWYRKEGNNIVRDEGESYTDYMYHTFMESPYFIDAEQTTSKVTTLNKIWEDDSSGDDTIGDYNGYQFKPSDLIGNTDYTEFRYDKHNWVRLTLKITPLTSSDSVLNEYGLEGTLYMIENEDSGTNYEAYGYVNVDIGNKLSNKNREMWRRQPSNHLSIKKRTGHTIKLNDVKFYERSGFIKETSKQTLLVHGYVKEDDNNGEDKYIGNYEGLSLSAHELARPQGITRTFASDGGSGGRVVLKLKLRNYTKERAAEEAKDREMLAKKEAEKKKTDKKGNDTPVQKEKKEL